MKSSSTLKLKNKLYHTLITCFSYNYKTYVIIYYYTVLLFNILNYVISITPRVAMRMALRIFTQEEFLTCNSQLTQNLINEEISLVLRQQKM